MYQLTKNPNEVIRLDDGAIVPRGHRWWNDYEAWLQAGGVPQPEPDTRAVDARAQRDGLLRACDWTQSPDSPLTAAQKTAWAAYRQALRDVPEQTRFPGAIDWPTQP